MLRNFKFDYDMENDSLFLYRAKSKGSVQLGDFILDYNAKKELVGIEILHAAKILKKLVQGAVSKRMLSSLEHCKVDVHQSGNLMIVKLHLYIGEKELVAPINIPSITEQHPLASV
ncbi:MAG: DUF2283 domain-containing protein [Candidatus Woesearchaeota archaeon]|nr:DUF2283 domain-containing protein [Candidatus Woesearchaeota archaeon]